MPLKTIAAWLPLLGALGICAGWIASLQVLGQITAAMNNTAGPVTPLGWAVIVGAVVYATGLISIPWVRVAPSQPMRIGFGLAIPAMLLTFALVGWGNTEFMLAFGRLAVAENVSADAFAADIRLVPALFLGGGAAFLAAAACVFYGVANSPAGDRRLGVLEFLACGAAVCAAALTVLASLWHASSIAACQDLLLQEQVKPDVLASSVSSTILSMYMMLLGILGSGLVLLLLAIRKSPAAANSDASVS